MNRSSNRIRAIASRTSKPEQRDRFLCDVTGDGTQYKGIHKICRFLKEPCIFALFRGFDFDLVTSNDDARRHECVTSHFSSLEVHAHV